MTDERKADAREDDAARDEIAHIILEYVEFGDSNNAWSLADRLISIARRAATPAPAGDEVERVVEAWYAERALWHFDPRGYDNRCRRSEAGSYGKTEWFDLDQNFIKAKAKFAAKVDQACARAALAAMPERGRTEWKALAEENAEKCNRNLERLERARHQRDELAQDVINLQAALAAAEARGMMRAAEIVREQMPATQDWTSTQICEALEAAAVAVERAAASQPVEAVREDAPRVVDHPEDGYSEWLREDVPVDWIYSVRSHGFEVAFAEDDQRFVGVRWPLAPQPRDGWKA